MAVDLRQCLWTFSSRHRRTQNASGSLTGWLMCDGSQRAQIDEHPKVVSAYPLLDDFSHLHAKQYKRMPNHYAVRDIEGSNSGIPRASELGTMGQAASDQTFFCEYRIDFRR